MRTRKRWLKTLLSLSLSLMMTFCAYAVGIVTHASETVRAENAFAFIKVDGKEINLSKCPNTYYVLECTSTSARIEWELKDGWAVYQTQCDYKDKEFRSGDSVRISKEYGASFSIIANDNAGQKCSYSIEFSYGKLKLSSEKVWERSEKKEFDVVGEVNLRGFPVVSLKSSKPDVVKVKKGKLFEDCYWIPKKAGKSKITVVLKINGVNHSLSGTYTVKKYPNALKLLKVDGKKVNFKKYPFLYKKKAKKRWVKLEYKLTKGWKLVGACYTGNEDWDVVDIKSGSKMYATSAVITLRNKSKEEFYYTIILNV